MKPIDLKEYLQKLKLGFQLLSDLPPEEQIKYLNSIYLAHIKVFPYSNFELRRIANQHPVQRQSLSFFNYTKLLSSEHGGYCYQSAGLLFDALMQLGFKTEYCAARVLVGEPVNSPKVLAIPATHLVLVVTLGDKKFLLDPGLGASAPRLPILITEKDESILQGKEEFKFYKYDGAHVLERKTSQGWFRLMQTDLIPIDLKTVEMNLLKLERYPDTISIRDNKTVVGSITEYGRKSLVWDAQSNQLKFSKHDGDEVIQKTLTSFEEGVQILVKEFDIDHISAQELKTYCTETNLPQPIKPWTVDFPLDQAELKRMEENLIFRL
ncbi:TPA: arylamine N-acetyltransferase family protein [Legionella pneumophila]|uniref:arylamine N-acetyltransferase family protein n=1 Tax=Legionella pneumophila TaxID=446 RepID=UPI0007773C7E|nr:arylamine N-acetyltransferase [Legionella pneumophila]HAU0828304.1 arylamine N-acetyltransferase [Legionella pneumophila]HBD7058570.1 arylamine N-acetyltransferase [Legionella pneumophila]HCQ3573204.1 arylamine N-acetyltransferase [Legionella pneumophila]HEM7040149.1 arylamine N-acetyltransferase [Legionella pneumophila]HEO1425729.1 arylamine N-acetyltransferase [Legionella pneumophila]